MEQEANCMVLEKLKFGSSSNSHTVTIKFTTCNVKLSCITITLALGEYDPDPVLLAGDLTDPREHTTRHSQGYL